MSTKQSAAGNARDGYTIKAVRSEKDLKDTIELFYEYTKWLDLDLTFQNFDEEMAGMPGKYASPPGELLLARTPSGMPVGCVALRKLEEEICEMKRLWVRDSAKGLGLGKDLILQIIDVARQLGYRKIRLDTLPRMTAAIKLYQASGFIVTGPYYATPLAETIFLELDLSTTK